MKESKEWQPIGGEPMYQAVAYFLSVPVSMAVASGIILFLSAAMS